MKETRQLLIIMTTLSVVLMVLMIYFAYSAFGETTERGFFFYFVTGGLPAFVFVFVFRSILNLIGRNK